MSTFSRFFDDIGNGSGNAVGARNFSGVEPTFLVLAPLDGQILLVTKLFVTICATGPFASDKYAKDLVLEHGIRVLRFRGLDVVQDVTDGQPIKTNTDWTAHCYYTSTSETKMIGPEVMAVLWEFSNPGQPLELASSRKEFLAISLQDDFSSLITHSFVGNGFFKGTSL